jgi:hypothetical protein
VQRYRDPLIRPECGLPEFASNQCRSKHNSSSMDLETA